MSLFRKKAAPQGYDPAVQVPVLRCSICTGEQVAGFKDIRSGAFTEAAVIRSPQELAAFKKQYGLTDIRREY